MNDRIVSADSHVNPPKDLWVRDCPAEFKDRAPRVESGPMGDFWVTDSQVSGAIGLDSSAGRKPEELQAVGPHLQGDAARRVRPEGAPRGHGPRRRRRRGPLLRRPGHAVRRPTRRSVATSSSATTTGWSTSRRPRPTRLVGLAHIPLLDLDEAQAELTRVAKVGSAGLPRRSVPGRARRQGALGSGLRAVLVARRGDRAADELPHRRAAQRRTSHETFANPTPGHQGDVHRDRADLDLRDGRRRSSSPASSPAIRSCASCSSSAASAGSPTSSSAWTRRSTSTASGRSRSSRRSRARTGTARATRRSSRTSPASPSGIARVSRTSCGRRTIRTRTAPGRSRARRSSSTSTDVPANERALIAGGNCSALYGLN